MNPSNKIIFEAIGEILGTEKRELREELDRRFAGIDGAVLLKSTTRALLDANLAALQRVADDVLLRKASLLKGDPSPLVRGAIEKGRESRGD